MKRFLLILVLIFLFPTLIQALPYYYSFEPVEVGSLSPRIKRSSPFVVRGRIITIVRSGNLLAALDAESGELVWEVPLGGVAVPDIWSDGRRVYLATGEREANFFMAINLITGKKEYYTKLPGDSDDGYNSRLVPVGELVLVPIEGGLLAAYDKSSGKEVWTLKLPATIEVLAGKEGTAYLCCGKHLIAVNGKNGEVLWDKEFPSEIVALGISGDSILFGIESTLYFADPETGDLMPESIKLTGGKVVAGEIPCKGSTAYVMTTGGILNFIDVTNREFKGFKRIARNAFDQPIIAERTLVFWSRREGIVLYDLNLDVKIYIPEYEEFRPVFRVRLDEERWSLAFLDLSGKLMSIRLPRAGFVVQELEAMEDLTVYVEGSVSLYSNDTIIPKIEVRSPEGELLYMEILESVTPLLRTRKTSFKFKLPKPYSYVELIVLTKEGNISWIHRIELPYEGVAPKAVAHASLNLKELGTLTVGEEFEVSGTVNVNVSGDLELLIFGEGIATKEVSLGRIEAGVERSFSIKTIPKLPGELKIRISAKLNGTQVGEASLQANCVSGSLIEGISPSSIEVKEGELVKLRVLLKNRLADNVELRVEASSDVTNKSSASTGLLSAGEEKGLLLTLRALKSGSSKVLIRVFHEEKVVEEKSIGIAVKAVPPTSPTPPPLSPLENLWRFLAPITGFLEPYIGVWGSRIVIIAAIAGIPLMIALKLTRRKKVVEELPPPPVKEVRPEEIEFIKLLEEEVLTLPEKPEVEVPPEVEISPVRMELEARISQIAGKIASLRNRSEMMENEGFTGLVARADSLRRLLEDVKSEISEGRYDYAKQLLDRLESNMISFERHLESLEDVLNAWNKIEGRVKMMLSLWGRAPASLLTMIPEELRVIALTRFARLHPEMRLELRDDELILLEE